MTTAIKQRVTVGPGGTIRLQSNQLQPGEQVEVTVVAESSESKVGTSRIPAAQNARRSLADHIGSVPASFKSVEEVDAYIRELRDEWE